MACQAMYMWSLGGLVGAFLDLIIAYFLLCASAFAFFASCFLGFFGLKLPCPCGGFLLNTPCKDFCLNRVLIDLPANRVANVQLSVSKKFPFSNSKWGRNYDHVICRDDYRNGVLEIEDDDASCSSVSIARTPLKVVRREFPSGDNKYNTKGKGLLNYRPRSRLHRHRKGGNDHGSNSSISSYDPYKQEEIHSFKDGNGIARRSSLHFGYENDACDIEYMKPSSMAEARRKSCDSVLMDNSSSEDTNIKRNVLLIEELREGNSLGREDRSAIHVLEQALEKEVSSREALYIELEKERSAAASAAEETMAMIFRLQEEKALIEMEARQHKRILEEKAAYDAEEMTILKEILVRREKEKYFLEKEVEAYRHMLGLGNRHLDDEGLNRIDSTSHGFGFSIDTNIDPVTMLNQLTAFNDKEVVENRCGNETSSICRNEKSSIRKQGNIESEEGIQMPECSSDGNKDQPEISYLDKSISIEDKEIQNNDRMDLDFRPDEMNILAANETGMSDLHFTENLKKVPQEFDESHDLMDKKDSKVYDVHVVGVSKSSSAISRGLPPTVQKGLSLQILRRQSMSGVDSEMLKIDNEVGQLHERLRMIREERAAVRQVSLPRLSTSVLSKRRRCKSVSSVLQTSS